MSSSVSTPTNTPIPRAVVTVGDRRGTRGQSRCPPTLPVINSWSSSQTVIPACGCGRSKGTGTYGAGLTRHLQACGERVLELDRPEPSRAPQRRQDRLPRRGAHRPRRVSAASIMPCRVDGGDRAALSVLITARRSAVDAAKVAHLQLHALICAAPELLAGTVPGTVPSRDHQHRCQTSDQHRLGHRDPNLRTGVTRPGPAPSRAQSRSQGARDGDHRHRQEVASRSARPVRCRSDRGRDRVVRVVPSWSVPQRSRVRQPRRRRPDPREHRASPTNIASVGSETVNSTERCTSLSCTDSATTPARRPTPTAAEPQQKTDRDIKRCLKRYIARQLFRQLENTA